MPERPIPSEDCPDLSLPILTFIFKSVLEVENEQEGDDPNTDEFWNDEPEEGGIFDNFTPTLEDG